MKKIISVLIITAMLLCGLCGCGVEGSEKDGRLKAVATIFPAYDFTRQISGGLIDLEMLLAPETESHSFEPTLQDIAAIQGCDLFIYIGGESEAWADKVLETIDTSEMTVLRLMDYIEPLCAEDDGHIHEHDHEHEGCEDEFDDHIWTSPKNAALMAGAIRDALCTLDAENADSYIEAAALYLDALSSLDEQLTELTAQAARHTVIFAERFPFRYLAAHYGLDYHAAFSGCGGDTEPSLATIASLVDIMESEKIPVVFFIEFSDETVADTICQSTGAKKLLLHSCHNLTHEELDGGANYIDLMQQNIENLREALN